MCARFFYSLKLAFCTLLNIYLSKETLMFILAAIIFCEVFDL